MALKPGDRKNFETLQRAIRKGDACLSECRDQRTGAYVAVICALNRPKGDYELVPLARMFTDNPYEEVAPPGTDAQSGTQSK